MSDRTNVAAPATAAAVRKVALRAWPPRRRGRKRTLFAAAAAVAVVAAAGVAERSAVAGSVAVLGHLRWAWMPAVITLESSSMVAFARMHRRLLAAGRARFGLVPMLATVYAANAVSVSVPLAGPELAVAFTFRRLTRQGADAPLAGWSLLVGGVVSTAAGALVIAGGGLASGNVLAAAVAAGVLAVGILAVGAAVPWHDLLLAYGAGIAAQSFSVTPGGLGVTEGTLGLALAAAGMRASRALAAVLLYRLVSFWLVALAGWLILIWLRHPWRRAGAPGTGHSHDGPGERRPPCRPARRRRPSAAPSNFVDISERAVVTPAGQAGARPPARRPIPSTG